MRPTLFSIFGVAFHAYPVMLMLGFVAGTMLIVREADRRGRWLPPEIGLWVLAGALFGARLFHVLQYNASYTETFGPAWHGHLWRALLVWQTGLVYYGGLLGGMIAAFISCRFYRMPPVLLADLAAPYLALSQAITRVGCFLNGCCWGTITDLPWAVQFPQGCLAHQRMAGAAGFPPDAPWSPPLHPTQLYMAAGLIAIFLVLKIRLECKRWRGEIAVLYALCYGLLRFLAEFVRGDSARTVLGMTLSQFISLVLVLFALGCLAAAWRGHWGRGPRKDAPLEEG